MDAQEFEGLKALLDSAFPKTCRNCGHVYETAEQFFTDTQDMAGGRSSLKSAIEDDGCVVVEVFRNCRCGSSLMDEFGCRREHSEKGDQRRAAFEKMLAVLQAKNIPDSNARTEIVNFLRGKPNQLKALLTADN
ncbi:MAG: hypothetical protein LUQ11_03000 [Methylococcaceae bacterium]|nr:hypothetical protein [Methylococcaceae bacterium]